MNSPFIKYLLSGFMALALCSVSAQVISVSNDLPIKNDRFYYLVGDLGNSVAIVRDKDVKHELEIFDLELNHIQTKELDLAEKRARMIEAFGFEGHIYIYYTTKSKGTLDIRVNRYDSFGHLADTASLMKIDEFFLLPKIKIESSKEGSKRLIYIFDGEREMHLCLHDLISQEVLYSEKIKFENISLSSDLRKILVHSDGSFLIVTHKQEKISLKKDQVLNLFRYRPSDDSFINQTVELKDIVLTNLDFSTNPHTGEVYILGFSSEKHSNKSEKYFIGVLQDDLNIKEFHQENFSLDLLRSVYGHQSRPKSGFEGLRIRDIMHQSDGGLLMLAEITKTYSRRPTFPIANNSIGRSSWVDYYIEDILLFSFDANGELKWNKVLHKRQFSQDDEAAFSSFFLLENPSSIRLIFNDEIKSENTVSEYVISPGGSFERNSLFTTDYQKIQLRFRDGIQVADNMCLVPSERSGKISIVKMEY